MIRIGIAGSPSSGKTTLARSLAASFVGGLDSVELISEYARRYIIKYGRIENYWEQLKILNKQLDWENTFSKNTDLIVTDSPIQLMWAYCLDLRDKNNFNKKENFLLNDIFSIINKNNSPERYNYIIKINKELNPTDDGIRHITGIEKEWIEKIDKYIDVSLINFPPKKIIYINRKNLSEMVKEIRSQI